MKPEREATLDDLRRAAASLTTTDTENATVPRIEKRALAALIEQAFSETPTRGLAYKEELDDLQDWLTACGTGDGVDGVDRALSLVGAWLCDHCGEDGKPRKTLDLVRAIAVYFVRDHAGVAAAVALDDERFAQP